MVDEGELSSLLSELAFTLANDVPTTSILDRLVERVVGVLPVTSAGVTLISAGARPHFVAASDDAALLFERLQTDLGQGPCLLACATGEPVSVPDLGADDRFPEFGPAGLEAGLSAVFAFPLRYPGGQFGALDLYRRTPGALDADALRTAQTLADVAAAYLLSTQAREEAVERAVRMRHLAMHDVLTGLPNRLLLQERIEHASHRARRSRANAALLFVDLDNFKRVNDTYGHRVGDELLSGVAARLSHVVRPGDTLARLHGDEFVLLCEELGDLSDVDGLTDRVRSAFSTPFVTSAAALSVTASIGVAFAGPEHLTDRLVDEADGAMYDAKRSGAGHHVIDLRSTTPSDEIGRLGRELQAACEAGEMSVVYQPIVRCVDGVVCGLEALVRWDRPGRGSMPTRSVLSVAERSGLMDRFGGWVLTRACEDAVRWLRDHPATPVELSVNVSSAELMAPGFVGDVAAVLAATGLPPGALVLELTEGTLIEDSELSLRVLGDLRAIGVAVALDDFGTGYASLSYLRRLPIDIVKIDPSFVADIERVTRGGAIVAAMSDVAHALELRVVAEGVETTTQQAVLAAAGVDCAQGFLYARPMPPAEVDALLATTTDFAVRLG